MLTGNDQNTNAHRSDEITGTRHHVYEIRPRGEKHSVDLNLRCAAFGRLWYGKPRAIPNAIYHAKFGSRSHDAVIRVYDAAGNAIETHEQAGDFREW